MIDSSFGVLNLRFLALPIYPLEKFSIVLTNFLSYFILTIFVFSKDSKNVLITMFIWLQRYVDLKSCYFSYTGASLLYLIEGFGKKSN
jgi:hypothetical protein